MAIALEAISILTEIVYCFFILKFAIKTLKHRVNYITLALISVFNGVSVGLIYSFELPFYFIYLFIFLAYGIELYIIAKPKIRPLVFIVSSLVFNISSLHLIIILIMSALTECSLSILYASQIYFPLSIIITDSILICTLLFFVHILPQKTLYNIANAKIYSEIMSFFSILMFGYMSIDNWVVMSDETNLVYLFSTLMSIICQTSLFYCLFYFNIYFTVLHPYKRKADQIKSVHGQIIEKKIMTEQKLYTDDLTGLYNKRFILSKLDELCENKNISFALVYSDLVGLKRVNDTFGHRTGDSYITAAADIFKNSVREDDIVARLSGDEFLIILYDISRGDLEVVINRIRTNFVSKKEKIDYVFHANLGYEYFDEKNITDKKQDIIEIVDDLMKKDKALFYKKGGI